MQDRACEWIVRLRSDTVSEADYQAKLDFIKKNKRSICRTVQYVCKL